MIELLSLGAGVQSSAVFLMSCVGELPKLDHAVFSDTGWEPKAVYEHLEWLKEMGKKHGIPIHTVEKSNIKEDALVSQVRGVAEDGNRWASMPYHTLQVDGSKGMIRRQCTSEYKIYPIEKFVRESILGLKKGQTAPVKAVRQWFGISTDEMRRVRQSRMRWAHYYYPLIETVGLSREGCLEWMEQMGFPKPARSACIGCPFKTNAEWRRLRDETPDEWRDAVEFDKKIRKSGGTRGDVYVHRDCRPLDGAPIDDDHAGQGLLFDGCETGYCGV